MPSFRRGVTGTNNSRGCVTPDWKNRMDTSYETRCFGDVLQLLRKKMGMTQEQLAGLSAVSVRAIRDLELGRAHRPRRETVRLLADALRLSGSSRALLESAAGRHTDDGTLRQMYEEGAASPPAPIGPLVGRDRDAAVVSDALETERLVSLTGLAGVGKTRLALAVARQVHAGGTVPTVWIPGYSGAAGQAEASPGVGTDLGKSRAMFASWVMDRLSDAGPIEELATLIGGRRALLVIDAYESSHVLHDSLLQLLNCCNGLRVLITTRVPLPFRDVRTVPLSPLSFATEESASTGGRVPPAVELLLSHLRYSRPTLEHTAATVEATALICRALDGIPLALNRAAAWFPVYSPTQLVPMACEAPFDLVEPLFGGEGSAGGDDLRVSMRNSIAGLRLSERRVLRTLALQSDALPADQVVERIGAPVAETAWALNVLLTRGLVRQERTPDGSSALAVLNLVRSVLTAAPAPRGVEAAVARV